MMTADGARYGVDTMTGALQRVAMRAPGAILRADPAEWHYAKRIDPDAVVAQYERFVALVVASGAEVVWLDPTDDDLADSVFTYDPSFVVPAGAVLLRPGKELRRGEVALHRELYDRLGVPVIGAIEEPGTFEGGDAFWLDDRTIAVGRGFRTNASGIEQFRSIVAPGGIDVVVFDLPYFTGPDACLHLMSLVSPLDADLALVHLPLLPMGLYDALLDRGYTLLAAPAEEFEASLGLNLNVLATAPRRVIAVDGFPGTVALMRDAGCEVTVFEGDELCIPCEGGPTCLTRPILRSGAAKSTVGGA